MKKHIILIAICTGVFCTVHAQELSIKEKTTMLYSSSNIDLPPSITRSINDYAMNNSVLPIVLNKNKMFLRVLYNENIELIKRIEYARYLLIKANNAKDFLPKSLIVDKLDALLEEHK